MALDPSIILNIGRGVTPLKSQSEIQDEQMQREVNSLKLNQLRQGIQDEQATRDIARNTAPDGLADAFYKGGYVKQGQEAQKFQTWQQKAQREAMKAKVEQQLQQFQVAGQIMNGVVDQATWDRARQQTAQVFGPEAAAQLPEQYDPALIEQKRAQAMTVKDQLEQKYKAMQFTTPTASAVLQAETSRANNAATVNQSATNARMTDERMREANALKAQENANNKQSAAEARNLDRVDKKVTAFSKELDKTNIPQFESLLSDIEADIAKSKDIPGYGGVMGNLPTFLQSEEGRALRQKIATLRNLTLKDRSGAAVTNQELERLLEELGTGMLKTDADLKRGLSGVRKNLDAVKQNVVAGVDDATLTEYRQRGGLTLKRGNAQTPPPSGLDASGIEAELRKRGLLK